MANNRNTHSSPGVYTQFTDIQYAAKTLGITTLGLVGETKKASLFHKPYHVQCPQASITGDFCSLCKFCFFHYILFSLNLLWSWRN